MLSVDRFLQIKKRGTVTYPPKRYRQAPETQNKHNPRSIA